MARKAQKAAAARARAVQLARYSISAPASSSPPPVYSKTCELNPIEFFWGQVKKYLCDHCDYTFDVLKANLPIALASVPIKSICLWEHQVFCWMDAYWSDLDTRNAQLQVKQFSS